MRLPGPTAFALLLLALSAPGQTAPGAFRLSSPDFADGGAIPSRFTCAGENVSPALDIAGVPPAAQSLVLIVDDPDAPSGTFTHWLGWNIPPDSTGLSRWRSHPPPHAAGMTQGTNDFGVAGYSGPCPPSGTHRYFFRLFALNTLLHLPAGASRKDLESAMSGHVIGNTTLMGRYSKTSAQ